MINEERMIYANDALKKIQLECSNYLQTSELKYSGLAIAKKIIEDAPTVDAEEVVHAKWRDVYLITPWVATGICSHCNLKSYINPDFPWSNYCPNCGAKMDS